MTPEEQLQEYVMKLAMNWKKDEYSWEKLNSMLEDRIAELDPEAAERLKEKIEAIQASKGK